MDNQPEQTENIASGDRSEGESSAEVRDATTDNKVARPDDEPTADALSPDDEAVAEEDGDQSATAEEDEADRDDESDEVIDAEPEPDHTPQIDTSIFDFDTWQPRPADDWDVQDADQVIELFTLAAQANLQTPTRSGCRVDLPKTGHLLMTGDLHDNPINLEKILKLADLDQGPDRHLILHEVVHSKRQIAGCDMSIRMLARVAALKLQYPNQLHLMMGNHEWAQYCQSGILKGGNDVVEAFVAGMEYLFGDDAERITESMNTFIRTLLLAVRCENGVFCSHSLPAPRDMDQFDDSILDRVPTDEDMVRRGPVYAMVWGRKHDDYVAEELSDAWDADIFLMGHQRANDGYEIEGPNLIFFASDHDKGVAIPIDLSKDYGMDDVISAIYPLASVE